MIFKRKMSKNLLEKIVSNLISKGKQLELFSNPKEQTFIQKFIEKADTIRIPYKITLKQIKRTERLFNSYKEISPERFIKHIKEGDGYGIISSAVLAESIGFNKFALDLFGGLKSLGGKTNYKRLKCILNDEKIEDFINSLSSEELTYAGKIFLHQKRTDIIYLISQKFYEKKDIYKAIAFNTYAGNCKEATNYLLENWEEKFEGDKMIILAHILRKKDMLSSLFYKKALECYEENGSKRSIKYARRLFKQTLKLEERNKDKT